MALPIAATPILKGKEAREFQEKIERDLKRPSKLIPTPKIEEARKIVRKYAANRKK